MKAWILTKPGGDFVLRDMPEPTLRRGAALIEMRATPVLSYMGAYLEGALPYAYPDKPFTPGTNGVGVVTAVGDGVYHLEVGQRVVISPYLVAAEPVADPAQILIGLTGISADCGPLWSDWTDGTLREIADFPSQCIIAADGLERIGDARLATVGKFIVPLGGLLRGRLSPGETVVIHGATGYFGSAATVLAAAMGAARIVAVGRNERILDMLGERLGGNVRTVALSGDADVDADAIRRRTAGGADIVLDLVGRARSADGTVAAMRSLRRGGRLVLMGSMETPLPLSYGELLLNNWEVIGNFMYAPRAFHMLLALIRSGHVDLDLVDLETFSLEDGEAAIAAAADMAGLDCTVVTR